MSDGHCWLAVCDEPGAQDAMGAATLTDPAGLAAGWLVAWRCEAEPVPDARRADPRIIDLAGTEAWISLVLPPRDSLVLFDDGAVQGARRAILADARPADAVTTLLVDGRHFAGALTVRRGPDARERLADDPFTRVDRAQILQVGPGLLGVVAPPPGPVIERHGSDTPWPGGAFA